MHNKNPLAKLCLILVLSATFVTSVRGEGAADPQSTQARRHSAGKVLWQGIKFFPRFLGRSVKQLATPRGLISIGATSLATYAAYHWRDQISAPLKGNAGMQRFTTFGREQYGMALNTSVPQFMTYGAGLAMGNNRITGTGYAMVGAFLLDRMTVGALQFATKSNRPDPNVEQNKTGGTFPSGHSASAATLAGVMQARHGFLKALPFHAAALYTGWSRIVDGAHRPHEVVAGLGLGITMGMASGEAMNDLESDAPQMALVPQWNPANNAIGLAMEIRF